MVTNHVVSHRVHESFVCPVIGHRSFFAGYGYPYTFPNCKLDDHLVPSRECFFAGFGSDHLLCTRNRPGYNSHIHLTFALAPVMCFLLSMIVEAC